MVHFVMCALKRCPKKSSNKRLWFFKIPKHPVRSKQWLRYCKAGTNPETGRVCSKHFMPSDYMAASTSGESMLKPDAVPTPCADTKLYLQCSVKLERLDLNKLKGDLIKEESDKKENTTAGPISVEEERVAIGQQLYNVLQSSACCCVCLRRRDDGGTGAGPQRNDGGAATTLQLQLPGDRSCSLRDALWAVLSPEVSEIVETGYLCEQCTNCTISAYLFIQNAKDTANSLSENLSNLQEEVDVILAKLEQGDLMKEVFFSFPSYMDEVEPKKDNDETQLYDIPTVDTAECAKWEDYDTLESLDIQDGSLSPTDQPSKTDHREPQKENYEMQQFDIPTVDTDDSAKWEDHDTPYIKNESLTATDKPLRTVRTALKKHKKSAIRKKDTIAIAKKYETRKKHKTSIVKAQAPADQPSSRELSRYEEQWRREKAAGEKRPQCIDCGYTGRDRPVFLEHARLKHIQQLHANCPKCQEPCYSKLSFEKHLRRCYVTLYICAYCDKEFHRRAGFVSHVTLCQTVKRAFACDKCDATFDVETNFSTHVQKRHGRSNGYTGTWTTLDPCNVCSKRFTNYKDYIDHKMECKKSVDSTGLLLCPECGLCVTNLSKHLRLHREVSNVANGDSAGDAADSVNAAGKRVHRRRGVLCELCGKCFRSTAIMNNHVENFHLKLTVRCTVCSKRVKKSSLKVHMRRHQENWHEISEIKKLKTLMRLTKCDECDYTCSTKVAMEGHMNRYHRKVRPFECETCGKSFYSKELLRPHARTHGPKQRYVCNECGREYASRYGLVMHLQRDHSTARPYECLTCGARFFSGARLMRHRYTHMPPERCPVEHCGSIHKGWIAVKKHLKRKHWKKPGLFDPALIPGMDPEAVERFSDRRRSAFRGKIYELPPQDERKSLVTLET